MSRGANTRAETSPPRPPQPPCRFAERGAGGRDVVDEEDRPVLQGRPPERRRRHRSHCAFAGAGSTHPGSALRGGGSACAGQTCQARQRRRDAVQAPPPDCSAACNSGGDERDRHHQRIVSLYQLDKEPRRKTRQEGRQLQAVTMLEGKNQVARAAGVTEAATDGGKSWQRVAQLERRRADRQACAPRAARSARRPVRRSAQDFPSKRVQRPVVSAKRRHSTHWCGTIMSTSPPPACRKWPAKCFRQVHDADSLAAGGKDSVKGAASFPCGINPARRRCAHHERNSCHSQAVRQRCLYHNRSRAAAGLTDMIF